MNCFPDEGQIYFHLMWSSQLVEAFEVAKGIVVSLYSPPPFSLRISGKGDIGGMCVCVCAHAHTHLHPC